jgi:hypothetical protein
MPADRATVRAEMQRRGGMGYVYPNLHGLNFVLEGALEGGCNFGLRLDSYGKCYASLILDIGL